MNGGGFIEGLLQDPHTPNILYARADVAGVFKSVDGGRSWSARNHGMTDCHQHDVRSIAISPHDSNMLFRCSGSIRNHHCFGTIHKSVDGGDFWYPVSDEVDFYGNGETRQLGEVIQVDPHDPSVVVAGGYSSGVWISRDEGENWQYAGLRHERIATVAFHPAQAGVIFVGTVGKFDSDPVFVAQQFDYVRPNPPRLYRSDDHGKTWNVLCEGLDFSELAFDTRDVHMIHAACISDGIRKSTDGGHTWNNHAAGLSKYGVCSITADPQQPGRLYAAAETYPNFDPDVPPIGVYTSDDAGESWRLLRWHTDTDIRNYPPYMTLQHAGWATVKIRVDLCDSQTLYLTNWYGVSTSRDGGQTWDANHFAGMENICVENIVTHPARPGTVYMVTADHSPKFSVDGGITFQSTPHPRVETTQPDSTAIVASRFNPDVIVYAVKGNHGCSIVRAAADGSDPRVVFHLRGTPDTEESRLAFLSRAAGVSVQALAEDPFQPGRFYAYLDGVIAQGAGIYVTEDWGDTWTRLSMPFPSHISRIPHERHWIENELLPVVIAQTKNVCGTNQLLAVDQHQPGVLYVGEWTEGIFRSQDGGQTWQAVGRRLPFRNQPTSVLVSLRTDPARAGVLYAGFIREGLWRSTDFGENWHKLFPLEDRGFNASSIAVGGADGNLIVVVCEPLYWSPCPSAVCVSHDGGTTWQDVYDPALGAIRWKTVALEPGADKFYAGSCGNSAFYLSLD